MILWLVLYNAFQPFANWLSYSLLGLSPDFHLGSSLAFFFYDVPKIILLLGDMIFMITLLCSFFSAEQTRAWLGGRREGVGNALAAALGIINPFGMIFSFLVAAPTIIASKDPENTP